MDIHMQKNKLGLLPQIICIHTYIPIVCASLVAQTVKNLPAIWETWTQSLGQEDPLEKGMATHSSILAWRIPWTEEPGGIQSMGSQSFQHDWATNTFTFQFFGGHVVNRVWLKGSFSICSYPYTQNTQRGVTASLLKVQSLSFGYLGICYGNKNNFKLMSRMAC